MFKRFQNFAGLGQESAFLWGQRQTGKSTLLEKSFPGALRYDLLLSEDYERLFLRPGLLREDLSRRASGGPVIIDEVQKIPALLDEIHWLIVHKKIQFILCGSSARKLKRGGANLLGGRALRYELFPLTWAEIPGFDLERAVNHGLLPRHYLAEDPARMMRAYLGDYLREEIAAEALVRKIPAFSRFLDAAAFMNGEILNYANIARECGVSLPTVKDYFQILEDTLLARTLEPFRAKPKRRVIQASKFYFFDVGLANYLLKRGTIALRGESFGKAFEHLIFQELSAYAHYSGLDYPLSYWRTASGFEVDFILGDEVAVEVKGVESVGSHHLRGLKAFLEERRPRHAVAVSLDARPRRLNGIDILPWNVFLERLWGGELIR